MASYPYVKCPWCGEENSCPVMLDLYHCKLCGKPYQVTKETKLIVSTREEWKDVKPTDNN